MIGSEGKAATMLHCTSCKTQVGVRNDQASSASIFKWQVLVQRRNRDVSKLPPSLAQCVSAMLLATMGRSGCSKSVLLPTKTHADIKPQGTSAVEDLLYVWVFNANITFSSTEASTSPTSAIKVFYRTIKREEADKMLDSIASDVQDLSLPRDAISTIAKLLNNSNGFIPEGDRKFKEWTVGLLEKWSGKVR